MSAFICSDEHIATIAVHYGELVGASQEDIQRVADALLAVNIASVNYRHNDDEPVRPCSLDTVRRGLSFADLIALCQCLDYQSCELPDYDHLLLNAITGQFKVNDRSGVKSALWDI